MELRNHHQTILVTGGAGFIGSNLVDALIALGYQVIVVDNFSTGFRENVHPQAILIEEDIYTIDWLSVFSQYKVDVVYHLAAQMDVRKSVNEPIFDFHVNMDSSVRLLHQAIRSEVKRFLFASSGGAGYGSVDPHYLPVSETYAPKPESPYGAAKMSFDMYLYAFSQSFPIQFVSLRLGNVFGPRQNPWGEAGVVAIFTEQMESGKQPHIFGDGKKTRDYVYVGDVVQAFVLALEKGDNQWINIGRGIEVTDDEIFEAVKQATGSPVEKQYADFRPGEVLRIALNIERAQQLLGWKPTVSLENGIQSYVTWYRARRALGPLSERR
ncbi:MAG: NAD-dependent epimerase/dehydratase family protein [bacterium]|nr:NAD-dependent epimerase/dehydratase family protein [bacterium]